MSIVDGLGVQTKVVPQARTIAFVRAASRGGGGNPELQAAYEKLQSSFSNLTTANGFKAVGNTEDPKQILGAFKESVEFDHDLIISQLNLQSKAIMKTQENTELIRDSVVQIVAQINMMKATTTEKDVVVTGVGSSIWHMVLSNT